jgi:hypothetical protein
MRTLPRKNGDNGNLYARIDGRNQRLTPDTQRKHAVLLACPTCEQLTLSTATNPLRQNTGAHRLLAACFNFFVFGFLLALFPIVSPHVTRRTSGSRVSMKIDASNNIDATLGDAQIGAKVS